MSECAECNAWLKRYALLNDRFKEYKKDYFKLLDAIQDLWDKTKDLT